MSGLEADFSFMGAALKRSGAARQSLPSQIALILRYLIATNAIKGGAFLPPLRAAATAANVNLHTMREAYRQLQDDGYLDILPSVGARVSTDIAAQKIASTDSLNEFLDRMEREARLRFGLDAKDLAALLLKKCADGDAADVNFIECSFGQASMHAIQVEAILGRPCAPIVFRDGVPAPSGFSVSTYFHLDEIDAVWPGKRRDLHLVHIGVSSGMADILAEAAPADGEIIVCEADIALGKCVAEELAAKTGRNRALFRIEDANRRQDWCGRRSNQPIFAPPRIWNRMPQALRAEENIRQIEYDIDRDDAAMLAAKYEHYQAARAADRI